LKSGRLAILIFLLAALTYGVLGVRRDVARQGQALWDLDYYRTAAERWSSGLDPYVSDGRPTGYYYCVTVTPLVAGAFLDFEAEALYAAVVCLAVLAALGLSMVATRVRPDELVLCSVYAVAFGNAEALYACASGNLSWLTGLLLAAALWGASRDRWVAFYALLGVASLIKPYALVLLLVPLALGALSPWALLSFVPLLLDAALGASLWPELPASRLRAIWLGVIEPFQLRYSLTGRLSRILADNLGWGAAAATGVAAAVQFAVAGALALGVRRYPGPEPRRAFALAVMAGFAALPRMAGYDAFLFGPAVFVAFVPARVRGTSAVAGLLALLAGLLKEGLAVLPVLALVAVWLRPAPGVPQKTSAEAG
jgi:hypothetical protein